MIPRVNQRVWIIVCWYLLLKCPFTSIAPFPGVLGSTTTDEKTRELQTEGSLENLYHRMLDNDEFTGMFHSAHIDNPNVAVAQMAVENQPRTTSRRRPRPHRADDGPPLSRAINHKSQINVAYSNLDNIFNPVERDGEREVHDGRFVSAPGAETSSHEATAFESNHRLNVPHSLRAHTAHHALPLVDQVSEKYGYANKRRRRSVNGEGAEKALEALSDAATEASSSATVPLTADASFSSSVAKVDDVSSRGTVFFPAHLETAADISIHAVDFSNIGASEGASEQRSPSRRSNDAESSESEVQVNAGVQAVSSNNAKVSNLGQLISSGSIISGAVAGHLKTDSTDQKGHGAGSPVDLSGASEKTGRQSSAVPENPSEAAEPKEGAITTSHSSVTSDSLRYGEGVRTDPSGTGIGDRGASFILLDDSVYVSHGRGLRRNGSHAVPDLPSAGTDLTLDSSVFGGRNFDEQIIFLNGPDLLETSVEQESSSPPVHAHTAPLRPVRRKMGKVARAVQLHDAEDDRDVPLALPLRPIVRDPAEVELVAEDNVVLMYADPHETVRLNCEVDADITTSVWLKDGQIVHAMDKKSRTADIRFVRESFGGLTIRNVMLEDDGVWQCEAENARGFFFNGRPIKLIVLDPPKEPYLLIDSRRLDAGNMFIPVKENSELTLACVAEGGNPKPTLTWEVLLRPGIDRHAQKPPNDVLELQEIKKDKDKDPYKINSGAVSEAKLAAVFRVHHNARILCIMEHPMLKVRQNASILLDVQYTPSFAITRTPGFGYPLREGIEVSLKCDVDSNPPSTPLWQKDDGDTPVPQIGDGFLNFSSIRREHSGWYKCTSRHLNFQYSSIGYFLSVRYEPVDVTSEPVEQDLSLSPSSSSSSSGSSSSSSSSSMSSLATNGAGSFKPSASSGTFPAGSPFGSSYFKPGGQMEVELGGSVTLQCPQGSLGCWSHLDSGTVRLKGPAGSAGYGQTGQVSLKDVVYQDAGTYKCVGQSSTNRKKIDVPQTVKAPTVSARNATRTVLPGTSLHLSVVFCANPPAFAARWLHGDRVYTPGNQYGTDVVTYGIMDLPTPFCKEARLTYVHMHEYVPRRFYFIVSSAGGVAEAVFKVNYNKASGAAPSGKYGNSFSSSSSSSSSYSVDFAAPSAPPSSSLSSGAANVNGGLAGYKLGTNTVHSVPGNGLDGEELTVPEEIHFPIFGSGGTGTVRLGLPVAVATLAPLLHWHRILYALPLLLPLLPLTTL